MIREDVAKVLRHPISHTAPFAMILEDQSRDSGNTQRIMRDLIAVILTKLEDLENIQDSGPFYENIGVSPIAPEIEKAIIKDEPKPTKSTPVQPVK